MKQVTETHTTGTATGSLSCCVSNLSLLRPCSRDLLYFRLVRREDSADKGPQGHRQTICFQSPCLPRASTSGNTWRDSRGGHGRQPGSRHPGLTTRERREQNSNDPLPSVVHKCHRTGGGHGEWSLDSDRRGRSQGPRKMGRTPAGITWHRVLWEEIKSLV